MAEVAALGIASNVISFIDFANEIFSASRQIYRNGSRDDHIDLELIVGDLRGIVKGLEESPEPSDGTEHLAEEENELQRLAKQCRSICDELSGVLEKLNVRDERGNIIKWKSVNAAIKTIWKKEQIQQLQKRMDDIRQELIIHVLMAFRKSINSAQAADRPVRSNTTGLGEEFIDHLQQIKQFQLGWRRERDQLQDDVKQTIRTECDRWRSELRRAIQQDNRDIAERGVSLNAYLATGGKELQRRLLEQLRFSEMTDRDDRIAEAYQKTFTWIFKEQSDSGVDFLNWLRTGAKIYWITGKPGSGKSTLMKYICRDKRTKAHLRAWASPSRLLTASFYFWNSGTYVQMSEQGLLRSLLFQILRKRPGLFPSMFPERWELATFFGTVESEWSLQELHTALTRLDTGDPDLKFCLFIDGLDEFSGDHMRLVRLLQTVVSSPKIKICTASRPWNVFEDAFKSRPSLMLQDLTYNDIKHFVSSNFYGNSYFADLVGQEPDVARGLVESVVTKAAGVFLWVHLVVRSLLSGLGNGDRISDLQKRLDLLPPDLENLYQKILDSIDPFYFQHACQLFQLVRCSNEPLSLLTFSFADEEPDYLFKCSFRSLTGKAKTYRAETMRRRINSRCKGLLELGTSQGLSDEPILENSMDNSNDPVNLPHVEFCAKKSRTDSFQVIAHKASSAADSNNDVPIADKTVQYLHRTVKDFLEDPEVLSQLESASRKTSFDPYVALCRSYMTQLKVEPFQNIDQFSWLARRCLWQAYLCEEHSNESSLERDLVSMLEEFDRAAAKLCLSLSGETHRANWTDHLIPSSALSKDKKIRSSSFLSVAVNLKLYHYVQAKLRPGCIERQNEVPWPLLADTVIHQSPVCRAFEQHEFPSLKMARLLLSNSADPNYQFGSLTIWRKMIADFSPRVGFWEEKAVVDRWVPIIATFLEHGAHISTIPKQDLENLCRCQYGDPAANRDMKLKAKQELDKRLTEESHEQVPTKHTKQVPHVQATKQGLSVHSLGTKLRSSLKISKHLLKLGRYKQSQVTSLSETSEAKPTPVYEMDGVAAIFELEEPQRFEMPGHHENINITLSASPQPIQQTTLNDSKADAASSLNRSPSVNSVSTMNLSAQKETP